MKIITGILADEVPSMFEAVAPMIQRAIDHSQGEFDLDDVYNFILDRDMQLWIVHELGHEDEPIAVVVTEIGAFPRLTVCRVVITAGKGMQEWVHCLGTIEAWAKAHDCDKLETYCRPGIRKVMKPHGFELSYEVIHKDLDGLAASPMIQ